MKNKYIENKEEEEEFAEKKDFWGSFMVILVGWVYGFMTIGFNKLALIACIICTLLAIIVGWYFDRD